MRTLSRFPSLMPLPLAALTFVGLGCGVAAAHECDTVTDVEGVYDCTGECVVTGRIVEVSGETDTVKRFPGAKAEIYQITITGGAGFHEIEIGALAGLTLRTATAQVSDGNYPVLEEYVFDPAGPTCEARRYTKIVRNPTPGDFKACAILCVKSD